jgi:hypothetical protein
MNLVEEHPREASIELRPVVGGSLDGVMRWGRHFLSMKVRMLRALPSTGDRLRAGVGLLLALAFMFALGRNLLGAIEKNGEIARLKDENAVLAQRAEALTAERVLLDDAAFLYLVARGYSLGSSVERPFTLAADAPELPVDAPGSAERRLSVATPQRSPIDVWMEILFGG